MSNLQSPVSYTAAGSGRTWRVCEVYPGDNGLVRVARVRTPVGTYLRPIHRLCLLEPMEESGSPDNTKPDSGEDGATKPV